MATVRGARFLTRKIFSDQTPRFDFSSTAISRRVCIRTGYTTQSPVETARLSAKSKIDPATIDVVRVDGRTLTINEIVAVARYGARVEFTKDALKRMVPSRDVVDDVIKQGDPTYGTNTGYGPFKDQLLPSDMAVELSNEIIPSHAAGVGDALSVEEVRATMLLIGSKFARGYSGVRPVLAERIFKMLNGRVHPYVPSKGSVGASGDLAPHSHIGLVLVGHKEGKCIKEIPPDKGEGCFYEDGIEAMDAAGIEPILLAEKEGLALTNGIQVMTAIGALTHYDAEQLVKISDIVGAMSVEAFLGCKPAFDSRVHVEARPQPGQEPTAKNIRALISGSELVELTPSEKLAVLNRKISSLEGEQLPELREAVGELFSHQRTQGAIKASFEMRDRLTAMPSGTEGVAECLDGISQIIPSLTSLDNYETLVVCNNILTEMVGKVDDEQISRALSGIYHQIDSMMVLLKRIQAITAQLGEMGAQIYSICEFFLPSPNIQDSYTLRCIPQVIGAVRYGMDHVLKPLMIEANSADDNPLVFPGANATTISAGNFHGMPVALPLAYFKLLFATLGGISERRSAKFVDQAQSRGLPAFLTPPETAGTRSGYMIPPYSAAALVVENRVLSGAACAQSISTSANQEDFVSMGTIDARQAREIMKNTRAILAIELCCATIALHIRRAKNPMLELGAGTRVAFDALSELIPPLKEDRVPKRDIDLVTSLIESGDLIKKVEAVVGLR